MPLLYWRLCSFAAAAAVTEPLPFSCHAEARGTEHIGTVCQRAIDSCKGAWLHIDQCYIRCQLQANEFVEQCNAGPVHASP